MMSKFISFFSPSVQLSATFAQRYYHAAFQNKYIRFINRASKVGISVGVAALIIGLSIMNGFERELKNSLLAVVPDVEFEAVNGTLPNWHITQHSILQNPNVLGAAPYIKVNAMVQKQNDLEAILLHGVSPKLETEVNATFKYIKSGRWLTDNQSATQPNTVEAVIGQGLADKLSLAVDDDIELLIPNTLASGKLAAPKYLKAKIVGIYQIGGQMDYGQVYVSLDTVQEKFNWTEQQAEGIKVALTDPFNAQIIARQIGSSLQDYVYVLDWFRTNGHVYNDIVMVKDIMYLVMVLVMSVACFNIVSSLTMAIQEKHSDIGILKTMGLTPVIVKRVFVMMGMLTAIKGIGWGMVWGVVLTLCIPELFSVVEQLFNVKALDGEVYFIDYLPTELDVVQVLIVSVTAFIIAYFATLYPASRASKLSPVELISG
ncbi:lipoprotein-releasing ABC transporter permease subunit [Psychrosphaera sp. F3M07]|uniref:lipoprotein-releasing ABC transporter permease subunit n=1 Tax=Psychrosphaera sp. F3M07 TaxID=2841560 RepID=UPI001C0A4088|nr:lipoprotein-releasing ABC transporter permease subunit [Psychrosphaera sp. F3M07]MBU2916509.1 lipoprotein-releasing ABC transporter permease subunit [Psychrosphaera sp. F3M07]